MTLELPLIRDFLIARNGRDLTPCTFIHRLFRKAVSSRRSWKRCTNRFERLRATSIVRGLRGLNAPWVGYFAHTNPGQSRREFRLPRSSVSAQRVSARDARSFRSLTAHRATPRVCFHRFRLTESGRPHHPLHQKHGFVGDDRMCLRPDAGDGRNTTLVLPLEGLVRLHFPFCNLER